MDKLEAMQVFVAVVEAGGFAAAARKLDRSRSAVNKAVAQLEALLNVQLLQRTTRRVSPTVTGLDYYSRCQEILLAIAIAETDVAALHHQPQGILKINAPLSFGMHFLAPVVSQFRQHYPQVQVQVSLSDRFIDPLDEGYDLTLRIATPPRLHHLETINLAPIPRCLCASPTYLAQHGQPHTPPDLKAHACLHYGYLASGQTWQLGDHDITVRGQLCANNGELLRAAALDHHGIALLPEFLVQADLTSGTLQRLLHDYPPPLIYLCGLYPSQRPLKVQLFLDVLRDALQAEAIQTREIHEQHESKPKKPEP